MNPPLPLDEAARLDALSRLQILDTAPEQAFDDLTLLATHICQVPMAMVSLVDRDRQWFKSKQGVLVSETTRDIAFCAHAVLHATEVFEVRDARADVRFADNPLVVGSPHVRFYAGAPLVSAGGHALGTLCVLDSVPRSLSADQIAALQALSRRVVGQLELRSQALELQASEERSSRLLLLADKSRRALLGVLEDEQRAARGLRESEERFRELSDNIQEVFWITDQDTKNLLYISPGYERIWGRTCRSLMENPRAWLEAVHVDDRERVQVAVTTKKVRGDYDETYRILRPNGEVRWIRDQAFPIRDDAGQVVRVVGTAEDITKQRSLEEQYRQAQKMEAIGTLAGGIAHDFNNILAAIFGYSELARLRVTADPLAREHLDSVLQAAQRARALVRQILTFSRQQEQERQPVQLRPVVAEPLKLLRATIPTTIDFKVSLGTNLPLVLADSTQIHQVVMNLCTNAAHAMRGRPGCLTVRLDLVSVDEGLAAGLPGLVPGPHVRMLVGDTGCGMERTTLAHIFEPFFTTKGPSEGTGLGLSVVYGIVKGHHGAINVESQPGTGTVFQIFFPAVAGEAVAGSETDSESAPRGNGERILVVDDEKPLALLGTSVLKELGYFAVYSTGAADAFARVQANPDGFDLVITDLTMPGQTGLGLARQIRALRPGLPVILSTGFNSAVSADELRDHGIREVLLKPYRLPALGAAVHRVLTTPPAT